MVEEVSKASLGLDKGKSHVSCQKHTRTSEKKATSPGSQTSSRRRHHFPVGTEVHEAPDELEEGIAGPASSAHQQRMRNPFGSYLDINPDYAGRRTTNFDTEFLLPRNPLIQILDEAKSLNFVNLTTRIVQDSQYC